MTKSELITKLAAASEISTHKAECDVRDTD